MRRNYVRRILCLPSRVAHSLVWILPDCHGIVAFLVISGKQRSSELLHTLRFICVCVGHLSASVQYLRHLLHNTEALLVFQATFWQRITISTNVDDKASSHRARVSHNIHSSVCCAQRNRRRNACRAQPRRRKKCDICANMLPNPMQQTAF